MFVDRKGGGGKKESSHTSSSFLPFQCGLFFVWLYGVMINTVTYGKRLSVTMERVVLVWTITNWLAPASQAHLAGPWDPAAGIHENEKKKKKKGYLIIIICGITQKLLAMCKQINLATLLNQTRRKVFNRVWRVSHENARECVQGTPELCVRLKKQCPQLCLAKWPMHNLFPCKQLSVIFKAAKRSLILWVGHLI